METISKPIVNRVAQSSLITIDLASYLPQAELVAFDLKEFLFKELLLKEKDFRQAMKAYDWTKLEEKHLAVFCSSEAIVPMWAYMLVAALAKPYAQSIDFGAPEMVKEQILLNNINAINATEYEGKPIVVKGCGDKAVKEAAYLAITKKLQPVVRSLMYGEACSSVPVYKKSKK